jgi:hypothetical protein
MIGAVTKKNILFIINFFFIRKLYENLSTFTHSIFSKESLGTQNHLSFSGGGEGVM